MTYRNLFIDLDDTLWNIHSNGKACLAEIYESENYQQFFPTFEDYYDVYMPHNKLLWSQYAAGTITKETLIIDRFLNPLKPFDVGDEAYAKRLNDEFLHRTTQKTKLIDGAIELLTYLRPRYRIHILSNGFREVQHQKISNSGLMPFVDKIILSEDAGVQKPHAKIFDFALINTNSRRDESIMIGDNYDIDIVGASKSRIDSIWYNPEGLASKDIEPTFTVNHLLDIKAVL